MNFEWMKDVNLLAYVLGSSLGVTFVLGIFLGTKKIDQSRVLYQFETKRGRIFSYLFGILMAVIVMMAIQFFMKGQFNNYKSWLVLSYWLSMIFIVSYVLTRKLVFSKDGVGYVDLFKRKSSWFYPWKKVRKVDISESGVYVEINGSGKPIQFKIKLDGSKIEEAKKALKVAMKS